MNFKRPALKLESARVTIRVVMYWYYGSGVGTRGAPGAGAPLEISLCTYITQLITYTHDSLYT